MKRLLVLSSLVLLIIMVSGCKDDSPTSSQKVYPEVASNWEGTASMPSYPSADMSVTFKQNSNSLSGEIIWTFVSPLVVGDSIKGTINSTRQILVETTSFREISGTGVGSWSNKYTAYLSAGGDTIAGTFTTNQNENGAFVLVKK